YLFIPLMSPMHTIRGQSIDLTLQDDLFLAERSHLGVGHYLDYLPQLGGKPRKGKDTPHDADDKRQRPVLVPQLLQRVTFAHELIHFCRLFVLVGHSTISPFLTKGRIVCFVNCRFNRWLTNRSEK